MTIHQKIKELYQLFDVDPKYLTRSDFFKLLDVLKVLEGDDDTIDKLKQELIEYTDAECLKVKNTLIQTIQTALTNYYNKEDVNILLSAIRQSITDLESELHKDILVTVYNFLFGEYLYMDGELVNDSTILLYRASYDEETETITLL